MRMIESYFGILANVIDMCYFGFFQHSHPLSTLIFGGRPSSFSPPPTHREKKIEREHKT